MVTIVFINFKLLANFNDVDLVLAMYGGDDENTLRQWKVFNPWKTLVCFQDGKVDGIELPEARLQFLSTATISSVQASSISVWLSSECPKLNLPLSAAANSSGFG